MPWLIPYNLKDSDLRELIGKLGRNFWRSVFRELRGFKGLRRVDIRGIEDRRGVASGKGEWGER